MSLGTNVLFVNDASMYQYWNDEMNMPLFHGENGHLKGEKSSHLPITWKLYVFESTRTTMSILV
jgi:hypothetical protein